MPYAGNYLHSIYIVLDVVSNLEMIFKVHRRMCIVYLFTYLFIFWLCWVFVSVRGLSLVVASGGAPLHRGARASHCRGFSCCGAQAPDAQAQ